MKLSVAWIFDHIDAPWESIDIPRLVAHCNQTTAEIEGFYPISFDLSHYALATVISLDDKAVVVKSPEYAQEYRVPMRPHVQMGQWYIIRTDTPTWARMTDFGGTKEHLLPPLNGSESVALTWKKTVNTKDYILELDNKSITHRPDLWGHRGFAREVAAMLNLPFKPLQQCITDIPIQEALDTVSAMADFPVSVSNKAPQACKRFAGLYIHHVTYTPSLPWMALRLSAVDSKSIDAIVDTTNYVMLDMGQPMHAFDAATISTLTIMPTFATPGTKLALLDGTTVTLTQDDLVISDGATPLALAGIMGGAASGVQSTTKALFVEAACFDATTIRLSAARHKIRTESSARFEKSLDPAQTTIAIMRLCRILADAGIAYTAAPHIVACGVVPKPPVISITHDFLERRLGVQIAPSFVLDILKKLGFGVQEAQGTYTIEVPTFRATKDVAIKEDIVEEVGRFVGYSTLEHVLPVKRMQTSNLAPIMHVRAIKRFLAFGLQMRELSNYALYDEEFLRILGWDPGETVEVKAPVSEHWRRLVTYLMPHLLKAVHANSADHTSLRFFEWGRTWEKQGERVLEKKVLAGIIFEHKKEVCFYEGKAALEQLLTSLKITATWHQCATPQEPWYRPYQTAELKVHDRVIGKAGTINQLFLHPLTEGDAFIFELDADYLESYQSPLIRFTPIAKYPIVHRDVSMLVPLTMTADRITHIIKDIDARITDVTLMDFFQKNEWLDQRAMTCRYALQDAHKTLTKEEVDAISARVHTALQNVGAVIR